MVAFTMPIPGDELIIRSLTPYCCRKSWASRHGESGLSVQREEGEIDGRWVQPYHLRPEIYPSRRRDSMLRIITFTKINAAINQIRTRKPGFLGGKADHSATVPYSSSRRRVGPHQRRCPCPGSPPEGPTLDANARKYHQPKQHHSKIKRDFSRQNKLVYTPDR